jgi:hypothetical protein
MLLVRSGEAWTTVDVVHFPGTGPRKRPISGGFVFLQKLVERIDSVERHIFDVEVKLNRIAMDCVLQGLDLEVKLNRIAMDCVLQGLDLGFTFAGILYPGSCMSSSAVNFD